MSYILQTNQLTKSISGKNLVTNVTMHVKKGEIYGFLGPNGAGKTTVMKMLTNLWKPTAGSIELFTSMSFLIFTSVMLSSFIVSAYKNKTMNLMFSYPIRRQKILVSQMLAVWIFNFIALVLTKVLIYGCILAGSHFMTSAFPLDFNMMSLTFYVQLILKSVVIVSMSFITLFIGLAMKSSKATIISSFLLIFLTQANIGDFTMKNNLIFPAILTLVSLICAILSVYNVENKDLM